MMTAKERLACGAGLLNSIDACRHSSNNPGAFLAVEQAIVDRELFKLETHCSERIALGWNLNTSASEHAMATPTGSRRSSGMRPL